MNNKKKPSALLHVIIVAVTLAAIAVTIFFAQKNHRETIRLSTEQFNQQQLILARLAVVGIQHFMAEIEDEICTLSNSPAVQKMEHGTLEQMKLLFMGIPQETSSRRLDKNGILRFIYPNKGWRKDLTGKDYSHETWFQKARETRKIIISGLIINEMGDWRVRVVKPVYVEDEKGTRIFNGVIIGSFDPKKLSELYISPLVSGETGYAWLLSEDGLFMAHHEPKFIANDAFKVRTERNPDISYDAINNIQRKMMAREEGTDRYMSGWHRGEKGKIEKFIAYTPVQVFDKVWSVAVCAPVHEVGRITSKAYRNELYTSAFIILILTAAGVFFFMAFYRWARSLEREIKIRKEAQERIVHLNAMLRALRNVNLLITKVKDHEELLQGACDNLIETRGYYSAWIVLTGRDNKFTSAAQAGVGEGFKAMIDKLKRGDVMWCMRQAVNQPGIVVVRNPPVKCGDCPIAGTYSGEARATAPLEYEGRVYGFLTVTVPVEMATDNEEQSLFSEVADDIAFALHTIEMEAERNRAEEELKKHHNHLEEIVKDRTNELEEKTIELEQANSSLQELDRLKSMFIASMSHELRTPLNSIIGFTGIILQGMTGEINPEQRDQLQRVYGSAKHLLGLITDVIDISKIEAGKFEVHAEKFSLDGVVREAVSNLTPEIANKGLDLKISLPQDIQLTTDRQRLLQCILNFLSNAIKFTEKGNIEIIANEVDKMIEIKVKDTGIGVKEEDLPKLFEPFVRLDSDLKIHTSGTGLGLYLTKKIATEMLGGKVFVESRYGEGSVFGIRVPREI